MKKNCYVVGFDSATGQQYDDTGMCATCYWRYCIGAVGHCEMESVCTERGRSPHFTREQLERWYARKQAAEACARAMERRSEGRMVAGQCFISVV